MQRAGSAAASVYPALLLCLRRGFCASRPASGRRRLGAAPVLSWHLSGVGGGSSVSGARGRCGRGLRVAPSRPPSPFARIWPGYGVRGTGVPGLPSGVSGWRLRDPRRLPPGSLNGFRAPWPRHVRGLSRLWRAGHAPDQTRAGSARARALLARSVRDRRSGSLRHRCRTPRARG